MSAKRVSVAVLKGSETFKSLKTHFTTRLSEQADKKLSMFLKAWTAADWRLIDFNLGEAQRVSSSIDVHKILIFIRVDHFFPISLIAGNVDEFIVTSMLAGGSALTVRTKKAPPQSRLLFLPLPQSVCPPTSNNFNRAEEEERDE